MTADVTYLVLGALSGGLVGFSLGLVGGGGSILAVPLMVYLVGVGNPHVAIGTSALAVAVNALSGLFQHARRGTIKWPCGTTYAAAGIIGALAGSTLGKNFDGERLLFLFAIVMIVVGWLMLRGREHIGDPTVRLNRGNAPAIVAFGAGSGAFSGFFGIGGGFLIVPGIMTASGMPILNAVGTSLIAVAAFGFTTAINYAWSGLIDWPLALLFIGGGLVGSFAGTALASKLSGTGKLGTVFAIIIFVVAGYMLWQSADAMLSLIG